MADAQNTKITVSLQSKPKLQLRSLTVSYKIQATNSRINHDHSNLLFINRFAVTFLAKAPVAYAMNKDGGYDNKHPRAQQAKLIGFGARALAAHQNAFESLVIFAPAMLLAIATNHTGQSIHYLAIGHIIARVAYHVFYLLNWDILRSTVWAIGLIACFAIVWQCLP